MKTIEIANRLVELCRNGDYQTCYEELFSPDVESFEPESSDTPYSKGLTKIGEKGKVWAEHMQEFHDSKVSDPIAAGNFFSCTIMADYTLKGGQRIKMEEVCVYEVKDGKIIKEIFYY